MNPLIDQITRRICFEPHGIRIASPVDQSMSERIVPGDSTDEAVSSLSQFLYCHFHAGCPELSRLWLHHNISGLGRQLRNSSFLEVLRAANPGSGYPDPGWTVIDHKASGYHVRKDDLTLFVETSGSQNRPEIGTVVPVRFPSEVIDALPGFYVAQSDFGPVRSTGATRIYLHLDAERAPQAIRDLLETLLESRTPYTLKVVSNPAFFSRRDNCVLYIRRRSFVAVAPLLLQWCNRHPGALRHEIPAFTLKLRNGIGVADSPADEGDGSRTSFGQQRMHALALVIIEALATGRRSTNGLAKEIHVRLAHRGIDPDRPWLATPYSPEYPTIPGDIAA